MTTGKKKSVLFICPSFFGYETSIKKALENNGFTVDFFDERFSNNSVLKAIFRIKKELLNAIINRYYNNIAEKAKFKYYDYLFLVKGEVIPENFILKFKNCNPAARLIFYTYDSFNNNNLNSIFILKHFDKCYSFDFEDVKNNPLLTLKHLFYTDEFIAPNTPLNRKYDISFVGTLHSARYVSVKKLFKKFSKTYTYFYMPAKWFFILQKFKNNEFKNVKLSEVSFKKLSKQQVADVFRSSKSVFDLQRAGQSGLTMRTFEVLAAGAILITANQYIKQTEFYDPDKIIVLQNNNPEDDLEKIIDKTVTSTKTNITFAFYLEKYHINNWVKELFDNY